jgi:two-component system sensor histidine kinase SenX3
MMIVLLSMLAAAGWVLAGIAMWRLRRTGRELGDAHDANEDRVSHAEAVQHWLLAALDESTDAVVVVDRIGREVVRNAVAHRFAVSRTGEMLSEDALTELLQEALAGHSSGRELQLYGPPRQVLQLRAFPLRHDNEVVGAVGFTRDISESRRIESMRRDFVANVSHELKTPIGALGLLAETIAATDDPEVVRRLADRIIRESDRLSRIVDDLLDLSTIEAQEAPIREPWPVAKLIAEAADYVGAAAAAAGVPVEVMPVPAEVQVSCDERQLQSAVVNLLDNAIKYSSPGAPVEVDARVDGDRVAISVKDRGIGIPSRDLERIFERFYRVDRARSRETGGTGLGLAIVRHVVQAHGGEVTVHSREGEGSTFTVYLPVAGSPTERAWPTLR